MAADPDFLDHVLDLFAALGPIRTGGMFSGTALYLDDAMFAVILGDTVYMKSDAATLPAFAAAGASPFTYDRKDGPRVVTGLQSLPDDALDDPDAALHWARLSLQPAIIAASKRAATKNRARNRKTPKM